MAVSALNLLLSPPAITISALLRREMAFDVLAGCNLAANGVIAATSVTLAAMGDGFMAPVWGSVAGSLALAALLTIRRRDLRIFRPCWQGSLEVFRFGVYSSAVVIINVFYQASPQLILGRVLDFGSVGLYGRAVNVTQVFDRLVLQALNPVVMPAIFAARRAGGDLKRIYLGSIELLTAAQWPFLVFLALMAEPIVGIWLGPKWAEIVPLVQIFCVASLSLFAACLTYPVLVAVGRVQDTLTASLISLPPSLLAIFIASFFGVKAVAASALLTFPLQAAVALWIVGRQLAVGPADLVRATLKSGIVTACTAAGAAASLIVSGIAASPPAIGLIGAGIAGLAGWCLGLVVSRHPLLAQIREAADKAHAGLRKSGLFRRGTVGSHGKA